MKKVGRPPAFESPEQLWDLFCTYKAWTKANPYRVQDYVGKDGAMVYRDKERPLTFRGFEGYLAEEGWCYDLSSYQREEGEHHKAFLPILTRIRATCDRDMVECSGANVYNSAIAVRVLGLADKQEQKLHIEQPLFGDDL